jgi:hypothetical protein
LFEYKYRDLEITEIYKDGVRKWLNQKL